jgi:hypothetical protein
MISERVRRILISMDSSFTPEELENMTDREGWAWIYESRPPNTKKNKNLPEICFTGFDPLSKAELKEIAESQGYNCVTGDTVKSSLVQDI